ncbi:hypothetical protein [Natrinema sp. CGMCC1.2065]|uniref:hypothetical protein n=1 Tax=Natrinema sp. CGMCC1.2065 TaxID=3445767 RepID=UPI003F49B42A
MSAVQQTDGDQGDLGDELFQIRHHTLDRDRVRGEITTVEDGDGTIVVNFEVLTTGQESSAEFAKPKTWSPTYGFVRLVEWCGYSSASAMQLEGEEIPLRYDGDEDDWRAANWEIDIERMPGEGLMDRADYYNGAIKGTLAGLFVAGAFVTPALLPWTLPLAGMGIQVGAASVAALIAVRWIHEPPDDDRRATTYEEIGVGFDE